LTRSTEIVTSAPTFTLTLHGTEKRVINVNYQKYITVDGNLTEIGKHTVVFSGRADLRNSFATRTSLPAKYVKITINESTAGEATVVAQISEIRVFGNV